MSPPVTFVVLGLWATIFGVMAYYAWFDYQKFLFLLDKIGFFKSILLHNRKWAATKSGEWYFKLFSLLALLMGLWALIVLVRDLISALVFNKI